VTAAFDPTKFNFVRLEKFQFPGGVAVYEYKNHPAVSGNGDFLRINLYLSMDGDYVTIWHGLLEPLATEVEFEGGRMTSVAKPEGFDLGNYTEQLFRGYIDSDEIAQCVFKALRVGEYLLPQILSAGADHKLRCDAPQ